MIIRELDKIEFEEFKERGATKVLRRKVIDDRFGSFRFYLRYYKIEPGGMTPYDIHNYEHILIITKGKGAILTIEDGKPVMKEIKANDIVFIRANEPHQIINTGNEILEFHCFRGNEALYTVEIESHILQSFKKQS
ncbi:MAG: cupin domain-containing protein [Thermoproteota archaeon]|jgi:quercetin dioxygenase-like cupin family protein|nr:cupin domain-containing protein [Thermoproteota archaeon]